MKIITGCSLDIVSLLQVKTGNETVICQCVVAKNTDDSGIIFPNDVISQF